MGVLTSAWSYNAVIQAWEPILEPWKLIVKMDMNTSGIVRPISKCSHQYTQVQQVVSNYKGATVWQQAVSNSVQCRWRTAWRLAQT